MNPRIIQALRIAVLAWLALYAIFFLYHGARLVAYPYDVDNSEAYLVHQGARIADGQFLYPPIDEFPYLVDNYPPVYPLLEAVGFLWSEPNFHWPRFLSLASTVLAAALIGVWIASLGGSRESSWVGGLAFLSFYHVYDWCALARVDSVGLLFTIAALAAFQRSRAWLLPALFCVLALFTKQSFFAAPAAITAYFFINKDAKSALKFLAAIALASAACFTAMLWLSGGEAFNHLVVYNKNEYRLSDVWHYIRLWTGMYTFWGAVPVWLLCLFFRDKDNAAESTPAAQPLDLLIAYAFFSIGESALCGKIGSAPNYILSTVCATAVGLGFLHSKVMRIEKPGWRMVALFFLAANLLQLGGTIHAPIHGLGLRQHPLDWAYTPSKIDFQTAKRLENELRRAEGPIFADRAGLPLAAGRPPVAQPFILTQLSHQGLWDQSQFVSRIEKKEFPIILLMFDVQNPNWDRERFTQEMIAAMRANYQFEKRAGAHYIYRPD